ncbi:hypothetical protein [Thermotalea metallivorans]|uniref:Uncharacterized protein n=1 Tax=Thermotalea metallivorans TaxID=520762 RepID=A0A140L1B5_9FIRM|nr:hypothetical protein [Thermotalea metallivorans]KXG74340.1 hypothetical protein AN619_24330 [Thermotalea metallivorans]
MAEWKKEKVCYEANNAAKMSNLYRIFFGIFILSAVFFAGIIIGVKKPPVYDFFSSGGGKQQIFTYLERLQPIEERFYPICNQNMAWMGKGERANEEYSAFLDKGIGEMEEILRELARISTNPHVLESHLLLMDEIKTLKDMMLEQQFGLENHDPQSVEKAKLYFKKYVAIAQSRRIALKKMMETYKIPYIDLGDRIKYKVE